MLTSSSANAFPSEVYSVSLFLLNTVIYLSYAYTEGL